jgi:hypothetical protein
MEVSDARALPVHSRYNAENFHPTSGAFRPDFALEKLESLTNSPDAPN